MQSLFTRYLKKLSNKFFNIPIDSIKITSENDSTLVKDIKENVYYICKNKNYFIIKINDFYYLVSFLNKRNDIKMSFGIIKKVFLDSKITLKEINNAQNKGVYRNTIIQKNVAGTFSKLWHKIIYYFYYLNKDKFLQYKSALEPEEDILVNIFNKNIKKESINRDEVIESLEKIINEIDKDNFAKYNTKSSNEYSTFEIFSKLKKVNDDFDDYKKSVISLLNNFISKLREEDPVISKQNFSKLFSNFELKYFHRTRLYDISNKKLFGFTKVINELKNLDLNQVNIEEKIISIVKNNFKIVIADENKKVFNNSDIIELKKEIKQILYKNETDIKKFLLIKKTIEEFYEHSLYDFDYLKTKRYVKLKLK